MTADLDDDVTCGSGAIVNAQVARDVDDYKRELMLRLTRHLKAHGHWRHTRITPLAKKKGKAND